MSHQRDAFNGETEPSSADNGRATVHPSTDAFHASAAGRVERPNANWVTECAWCKRVRSLAGEWLTLIPPIRTATGVELTHGICPQCAQAVAERAASVDGTAR